MPLFFNRRLTRVALSGLVVVSVLLAVLGQPQLSASAAAAVTITPITWNVMGLDSNNVSVGPNDFPVGVRVCNPSTNVVTFSDVEADFVWMAGGTTTNDDYIHLRGGSLDPIQPDPQIDLAPNGCYDFYFEVEITRNAASYDQTRRFRIDITYDDPDIAGIQSASTMTPREIYVEHLVSQSRNYTTDVLVDGFSYGVGEAMTLMVGQTYDIQLVGSTATNGYEQIETFINFPNTIFQVNSVTSTYTANSGTDSLALSKLYANGCRWENDPASPNYRKCWGTGKYGGNITINYNVTVIGGSGTSEALNTLIYDFSGSSYHYNSDYSSSTRIANIVNANITKSFAPKNIAPGGTSTLSFSITNPGLSTISGLNFTDDLSLSGMEVEGTTLTYSGCNASSTPSPASLVDAATLLSFSNISVAALGTCTISLTVTSTANGSHLNTSGNLYIGTTDTLSYAQDTLVVSSLPAPPTSCTAGERVTLASWDFATNTTVTIPDPTKVSYANATYSGTTSGVTGGYWYGRGQWQVDGQAAPVATNTHFQFDVDTSNFGGVSFQLQARINANGNWKGTSNSLRVWESADSAAFSIVGTDDTTLSTTLTTYARNATATGTSHTRFLVQGYYAHAVQFAGAEVRLDNVIVTGCPRPNPPTLSKSFLTSPITAGSSSVLRFSVSNPNTASLAGVAFSDTLPAGLVVATPNGLSTTCSFGTAPVSATAGGSVISLSGATLAASESCTISVNVLGVDAGQYHNVSGNISATNSGTNTGGAGIGYGVSDLSVIAPPVIAKSFGAGSILTGSTTSLTFSITNPNLTTTLSGVSFTDTLPAGIDVSNASFLNVCNGSGTLTTNNNAPLQDTVVLSGASMAPGTSCTFVVTVTGTTPNAVAYVNNVTVNSTNGGSGNISDASLLVKDPSPKLSFTKQVGPANSGPWSSYLPVDTGDPIYYRFIVENTGDQALTGVDIAETLAIVPAGLNVASCSWEDGDGDALTAPFTLPVAAAGNDNHIAYCVLGSVAAQSGLHTNTAQADSTETTPVSSSATYATAEISLNKSASPTSLPAVGSPITYTYVVTNSGAASLAGPVTVSDDKIVAPNPVTSVTCDAVSAASPGDGDNIFDPGESVECTAVYTVRAADIVAGFVTNTATATVDGVVSAPDSVTVGSADLSIDKTVSDPTPNVGDTVTFTMIVTNGGPGVATNVEITDALPGGYTYVAGSMTGGSTRNETGAPALVWTITSLPAGSTTLTFQATVDTPTGAVDEYRNWARVTASDQADPDSTPNNSTTEDDDDDAVVAPEEADLSLDKTVSDPTPNVGDTVTFTIAVTNGGPDTATNVEITDVVPAGYSNITNISGGGSLAGSTITWTIASLPVGSTNLTFDADVDVPTGAMDEYRNWARVTVSDQYDPDSTPDGSSTEDDDDDAVVTPEEADLSLDKTVSDPTPNVGDTVIFTITVTNGGPDTATNVEITDALPGGYTYVASSMTGGATRNETGAPVLVWTIASLPVGSTTLTFDADVDSPTGAMDEYRNWARVTASDQYDPDSTPDGSTTEDDDDDAAVSMAGTSDLSVDKIASDPTPNVGDTVTFTIAVTNGGPDAATNVEITDVVPAGYSNITNISGGGSLAGSTITWTIASLSVGSTNLTFDADVDVPTGAVDEYRNWARVTASDQADPDSTPNNSTTEDDDDDAVVAPEEVDLSLDKTVSDPTPNVGDTVTFTIAVTNGGPDTATNVEIADVVPAGYSNITNISGGGSLAGSTITWTIASLPVGSTNLTFDADVDVPTGAVDEYRNWARVTVSDQYDPDSTPDGSSTEDDDDDAVVTPEEADLSLDKTVSDPTPNVGDTVTFTIAVTNGGPDTATNVEITDVVPAGYSNITNISGGGSLAGSTITWTIASLTVGSTNLTFDADVDAPTGAMDEYRNWARVTASDQADPDSTPNNSTTEDDDDDAVVAPEEADLSLDKTVSDPTPNVGDTVTFTIAVTNGGPDTATNVEIADVVPAGYSNITNISGGGSLAGSTITWTIASLPVGSTNLTFDADVDVPTGAVDEYRNWARVTASDQADPDSTPNNSTTEDDDDDAVVTPEEADLSLDKTVSDPTPNVGDTVTFTIAVTNGGPDTATNVEITDVVPAGYSNITNISGGGSLAGSTITWTIASLPVGSTNLTFQATVDAPTGAVDEYRNWARVTASDQADPDSTPDGSSTEDDDDDATIASEEADLSLDKTVSDPTPNVGDTVTFTIAVTNSGPDAATNMEITDALPAGYTYVAGSMTGGATQDESGAPTLVWTIASLPVGSTTLTFDADVDAPTGAVDEYRNWARVTASDQYDPDSTPDSSTIEDDDDDATIASEEADLSLDKTVSDPTPNVGDTVAFTITVTNGGPDAATNVEITDALPAGYTYVAGSMTGGATQDESGAPTLVWTIASLPVGSTTLTFDADVDAPTGAVDEYRNWARVTASDQYDPDSTPDNSTTEDDDDDISVTTPLATISGVVWNDLNADGIQDPGEPLLAGVTVELFDNVGTSLGTRTTALDGSYSFTALVPGDYTVVETDPTSYVSTTSNSLPITLTSGGTGTADFGDLQLATTAFANISGTVFDDFNANGAMDFGESPLIGVTVTLYASNGTSLGTALTSAIGGYSFTMLPAGVYTVVETDPGGYISTTLNTVGVVLGGGDDAVVDYGDQVDGGATVADPALTKRGDPSNAAIGDVVTYVITVGNNGNSNANNVVVTDTKPAFLDIVAINISPDRGFPVAIAGNTFTINFGALTPADFYTIVVTTRVNGLGQPPGGANNVALATSSLTDRIFNNSAAAALAITSGISANLPGTGFAPHRVTVLPEQPTDKTYSALDSIWIEIPALKVKSTIVGVPFRNGTWDVAWLSDQTGWLDGSSFPGWDGNSVLTAHVYGADGLPGPFKDLNQLHWGDRIILHAYGDKYSYEVRVRQYIRPENVRSVFQHEEKSWLTLVTCRQYDERTDSYLWRVLVRAVLLKVEKDQ